jgi:hypothetical protein
MAAMLAMIVMIVAVQSQERGLAWATFLLLVASIGCSICGFVWGRRYRWWFFGMQLGPERPVADWTSSGALGNIARVDDGPFAKARHLNAVPETPEQLIVRFIPHGRDRVAVLPFLVQCRWRWQHSLTKRRTSSFGGLRGWYDLEPSVATITAFKQVQQPPFRRTSTSTWNDAPYGMIEEIQIGQLSEVAYMGIQIHSRESWKGWLLMRTEYDDSRATRVRYLRNDIEVTIKQLSSIKEEPQSE